MNPTTWAIIGAMIGAIVPAVLTAMVSRARQSQDFQVAMAKQASEDTGRAHDLLMKLLDRAESERARLDEELDRRRQICPSCERFPLIRE